MFANQVEMPEPGRARSRAWDHGALERIAFVDPGSQRAGLCIANSRGTILARQIDAPGSWPFWARVREISRQLLMLAERAEASWSVIERADGFREGRDVGRGDLIKLGEAVGAYRCVLSELGPSYTVSAEQWIGREKQATRLLHTALSCSHLRRPVVSEAVTSRDVEERPDMLMAIGMSNWWWDHWRRGSGPVVEEAMAPPRATAESRIR